MRRDIKVSFADGTVLQIEGVKGYCVGDKQYAGTYMVEKNGHIIYLNQSEVRYIGYTEDIEE